ncbi:MAG: adenylosuccinate synthetase [Blastochloris sp.]|nr:adenylosuccinate synthetase [Blastochloris sp.]
MHAFELAYPEVLAYKLLKVRAYYEERCRELSLLEEFMQYKHEGADVVFLQQVEEINLLLRSKDIVLSNAVEVFSSQAFEHFIFEGAQGILLDMDFGFFPHVTRSHTTSRNAMQLIDTYLKEKLQTAPDLYYITRAYLSRHGAGYLPQENFLFDLQNTEAETNRYNPYQEHFRKSPLQVDLLNYALDCDRSFSVGVAKHLIITCTDQMPESKIPVYIRPQVLECLSVKAIPPLLSQNWVSTRYSDSIFGDLKNFDF